MNTYRAKPLRYPWPPMLYLTSILTAMLAGRIAELPPIPSPLPFVLPSLGFAVAMLAVNNPVLRAQLDAFRAKQTEAASAMTLPPASAEAVSPFSPQGGGAL